MDLIELKCLAIKDHLGRLPKNKDEIVSSGKEICIFIGDESIDNIWNSFENMKEPVDKVYDYFNNTDKKFSFFSLPYSEDEIIEGLHRWIDTMDVSDKERYYLLRNRLVPNDIITDILNM
ncbi:MAG: hypothetical protein U9R75_08830 [Candidatus Thermoplasmatota archaeon]|nr:hypothetical protein [Candidatus Thermoplasmatota archaeon]